MQRSTLRLVNRLQRLTNKEISAFTFVQASDILEKLITEQYIIKGLCNEIEREDLEETRLENLEAELLLLTKLERRVSFYAIENNPNEKLGETYENKE